MIATNELIKEHYRYIDWEVSKYPQYLREDLIQEGYYGLLKAIKKYDETKGIKLITYAIYYIKHYIYWYVKKNHRFTDELKDHHLVTKEDNCDIIYQEKLITLLPKALEILSGRELDIINKRYLNINSCYYKELGKEWGISLQRIQQIEVNALLKMRKYLNG